MSKDNKTISSEAGGATAAPGSMLAELEANKHKLALKTFEVTITETLQKTITVEALDICDAEEQAEAEWNDELHVLDSSDFIGASFEAKEVSRERSHTTKRDAETL